MGFLFNNDGFINVGDDVRFNPFGIPAWLQRRLSWKSDRPPTWWGVKRDQEFLWWDGQRRFVTHGYYPHPYLEVAATISRWRPWTWSKARPYLVRQKRMANGQIIPVPVSLDHPDGLAWLPGKVNIRRYGWRFDQDGFYLFGAAIKRDQEGPMEKGY